MWSPAQYTELNRRPQSTHSCMQKNPPYIIICKVFNWQHLHLSAWQWSKQSLQIWHDGDLTMFATEMKKSQSAVGYYIWSLTTNVKRSSEIQSGTCCYQNNFLSFWRHAKTKKLSDLLVLKGRIYMAEIIQIYYTNADIYSLCVFDFV